MQLPSSSNILKSILMRSTILKTIPRATNVITRLVETTQSPNTDVEVRMTTKDVSSVVEAATRSTSLTQLYTLTSNRSTTALHQRGLTTLPCIQVVEEDGRGKRERRFTREKLSVNSTN